MHDKWFLANTSQKTQALPFFCPFIAYFTLHVYKFHFNQQGLRKDLFIPSHIFPCCLQADLHGICQYDTLYETEHGRNEIHEIPKNTSQFPASPASFTRKVLHRRKHNAVSHLPFTSNIYISLFHSLTPSYLRNL
jgi:hypothetical protein